MAKSGYAGEVSNTYELRFKWSTSYHPETNTSTVSIMPQESGGGNFGGDMRGTGFGISDRAGVYINGERKYALDGSYGGSYKNLSNTAADWYHDFEPTVGSIDTEDVTHDSNGNATFTARVYCVIFPYNYPSASVYRKTLDTGTVTVTFHEDPPYTITYNANGGSGAPSAQNVYVGTNTLSSTKPSRTGYTFTGWNTNSSSTGTNYSSGGTISISSNIILYAKWTINSCTLTYDANGGYGAPSAQTVTPGVAAKISTTTPTLTGYTFDGWYTNKSFTGTKYNPGGNITISSNTTLYAKWNINSYTLTTKRNNNNYGTVTAGGTLAYKATKSLTATISNETGYTTTFVNWTISGTGSTLSSTTSNPTTFTMGTTNATVTANFNRVPKSYTLTFDGNGATGGTMSTQTFTYGTSQALYTNKYSRTDYNFTGWNTKANGTGTSYADGANFSIGASNTTLYAQWTQVTFQITYNANAPAGSGISPSAPTKQTKTSGVALTLRPFIANQSVSSTATYTLTANLNGGTGTVNNGSATKTTTSVYNQTYWCTNSTGTGTKYSSQAQYTANAAATMYALWNGPATSSAYTCILPSGSPTKSATATAIFSANLSGATNTKPSQSANGTCALDGWYTAATGGSKITTSSHFSANTNVYAHYKSPVYSSTITTPNINQCYKAGSTLLGWSTSSAATAVPLYAPGVQFTPTGSITLYGVWGDLGTVYIGENQYKILIYNGTSWDYYRAYIVNNNQWVAY